MEYITIEELEFIESEQRGIENYFAIMEQFGSLTATQEIEALAANL